MRKVRNFAVACTAVVGLVGMTAGQAMAANVYTADGSGPTGGTPSKPKAATMKAEFTIKSDGGDLIPDVVKEYTITIEGGRLDKRVLAKLPKCKMSPLTSPVQSADQCKSTSVVGKGQLSAAVGTPGNPIDPNGFTCTLPYNLYNLGDGNLGLFISATTQQCPVAVKQWIKVNVKHNAAKRTVSTSFVVPEKLQQPAPGLFSPVMSASFQLSPKYANIKVNGKTKKMSTTQAIGCTDKKRDVSIKFVTPEGVSSTVTKTLPC